jgi:hypothetical protein
MGQSGSRIVGDGTNAGQRGILTSGLGSILFGEVVPTGAIASRVLPGIVTDFPQILEFEMTNQVVQNLNFGLRYDQTTSAWNIITSANLDTNSNFSNGKAGDITNAGLDASWLVAFIKEADRYLVRIRGINYVFGSVEQNRFYFDTNEKQYNDRLGRVVKDQVKVLGINTSS